ncbi:hypothetical protein EJ110_NYTH02422 [Nymphaea thermarum]|nr:hypothetical protein EJ110_NYTH02422 [Nymphaea thermarum]
MKPNEIAMVSLLSACAVISNKDVATWNSMISGLATQANSKEIVGSLCACNVGQAAHVYEVIALVRSKPLLNQMQSYGWPNWSTASVCKSWKLQFIVKYIYAAAGWWKDVSVVGGQRKQMELRKPAGSSCVEVDRSIANSSDMLWPSATQSSYVRVCAM